MNNAKGENTQYTYNNDSLVTAIRNGRGYSRTYTYNARHEVTRLEMPDGTYEQWSYNANGDVSAYTNGLGQVINYVFDDASRITSVDYPTGTDTAISYDDADRTTQMVDASGTSSWSYNGADELTSLVTPQGTINYTYDGAGRPATMVQVGTGTTTYTIDNAGRLTSLLNPFSETSSFQYDDSSRVTRKTFSSGSYEAYSYDSRSRVTQIALKTSLNMPLRTSGYTFDSVNNVLSRTDDTVATTFTYDAIDQLLSEARTGYSASYTYDANGNRLTKTLGGATDTYSCDAGDKLTAITGANPKTFAYDACGRTTSITAGGVATNFSYDYEDRVTQITLSGMTTNSFGYNGAGTRVSKTDSAGSAAFMRNGVGVTAPVLSDGSATYTPGISEKRGGTTKFYGQDVKNGVAQVSTFQTISASKQYDAFGNQTSASGTWNGPFSYGGKYGYQTDSDTSYQLLGHRYYDPTIGRFLTRDPIGDGENWYAYCENNPVVFADPTGEIVWFIPLIIVAWRVYDTYTTVADIIAEPTDWMNWLGIIPEGKLVKKGVKLAKAVDGVADASKKATKAAKALKGAKSVENWRLHNRKWQKAIKDVGDLKSKLSKTKGKKAREKIEKEILKGEREIKGHEKEMKDKWGPNWKQPQ